MVTEDPREVVRRGYDALSARYDEAGGPAKYQGWLGELRARIPAGRAVLDLGCGSGLPVARDLAAAEGDSGHALFWASRPARPVLQPGRPSGRPRDKRVIRPPGGDMKLSGRHVTAALALAGTAILLPSIALASASRGAAPQRAAVTPPACGRANPALPGGAFVWASLPGDGFAGGVGYVVEITNEGRHACTLRGVPGAAVLDRNGHLIGSKLPASGRGPLVTLRPGATAHFLLTIHIAGAVCAHPVDGQVLIYLPGQRQAQNAWQSAPACPGLRGGGVLSPDTIRPGVGIPFYTG